MVEVSVICPVFDACPLLLRAAVGSVLDECRAAGMSGEVILVDDASTRPDTQAALRNWAGHATLLTAEINQGPASARNRGIAAARGEWIGFLDADDLWLPGRMAAMRGPMAAPRVSWIGGRHALLHTDGVLAPSPPLTPGEGLTQRLVSNFWMHLGAILVRRDVARRLHGFGEGLFYGEDVLFLARLSRVAPLHLLDREVYAWRRAGGGLTASPARLAARSLRYLSLAEADPLLRGFRREIRWALYSARKGLAVNNLRAGRQLAALRLAGAAWLSDPREVRDFARFLRLLRGAGPSARPYSQAETFTQGNNR